MKILKVVPDIDFPPELGAVEWFQKFIIFHPFGTQGTWAAQVGEYIVMRDRAVEIWTREELKANSMALLEAL